MPGFRPRYLSGRSSSDFLRTFWLDFDKIVSRTVIHIFLHSMSRITSRILDISGVRTMSDEIFFDGKRYISAHDAASSSDLTRDYIARLCRDGRVTGRRIGKNWYVEHASLKDFLI